MARIEPSAGEVWFAELGMVEKSRPVLVLWKITYGLDVSTDDKHGKVSGLE